MCSRFEAYCCISLKTLVLPPPYSFLEVPPLPQTVRIRWGRPVARALTNDVTKVGT